MKEEKLIKEEKELQKVIIWKKKKNISAKHCDREDIAMIEEDQRKKCNKKKVKFVEEELKNDGRKELKNRGRKEETAMQKE